MARRYSSKDFFRQMPNSLHSRSFEDRGFSFDGQRAAVISQTFCKS